MKVRKLTRIDINDILYGCAILGTGGGGELDEGFEYIEKALSAGKEFKLVSIDEAPKDAFVCTPYMLGALTPLSENEEKQYKGLPANNEPAIMTAYRRLKEYTQHDYFGTICCELGGSNTAISFYLAAMFDGHIIDADPAGRAVPEITHSTYYFNNIDPAPIVMANEFSECFICENVVDDQRAEHIVRALSMVSRNDIAAIDHAMPIKDIEHAVIKGTISKALAIGKAFREAKENKLNIAEKIASHGKGLVKFRGHVNHYHFETKDGFTFGEFTIAGTDGFEGSEYRIIVKNENLAAFLNGEVDVTIPDLICCIDLKVNEPVTNPNLYKGMEVAIIALPAPKEFLTQKGIDAFGPRYAGIKTNYKNIA